MAGTVGILGSGEVGKTLAKGFQKHGYQVMIGSDTPAKREELGKALGKEIKVGNQAETAAFGGILVLTVKGLAAEKVVQSLPAESLRGKTILDTTNPITDAPPVNGVLQYFTSMNQSLMERLQQKVPDAHFVKAFSCVGAGLMVNPALSAKPTMFICGNNDGAKDEAAELLQQFGWEVEDLGSVEAARAIEPLAILWCIPGFRQNNWMHAFKDLKS